MKEIVIRIDEATYHRIVSGFANEDDAGLFADLFKNGIELPKGHGELKDVSKILAKTHAMQKDLESNNDRIWAINKPKYKALAYANRFIIDAETLVEADKGYEVEVVTRGNCMMCGKELTEGLFFCKECEDKAKKEIIKGEH